MFWCLISDINRCQQLFGDWKFCKSVSVINILVFGLVFSTFETKQWFFYLKVAFKLDQDCVWLSLVRLPNETPWVLFIWVIFYKRLFSSSCFSYLLNALKRQIFGSNLWPTRVKYYLKTSLHFKTQRQPPLLTRKTRKFWMENEMVYTIPFGTF